MQLRREGGWRPWRAGGQTTRANDPYQYARVEIAQAHWYHADTIAPDVLWREDNPRLYWRPAPASAQHLPSVAQVDGCAQSVPAFVAGSGQS